MRTRNGYLKMQTDNSDQTTAVTELISSDFTEFKNAAKKLASYAITLGSLSFCNRFVHWFASFAAIYLLVLNQTQWKMNILYSLLVPYIFFTLPSVLFNFFHGQVGKWIAFVAVILRIFFPKHFPDWLELPAAIVQIIVVAPTLFADTLRDTVVATLVCLIIAAYLFLEYGRETDGFRNSFAGANGFANLIGILLLLVYPAYFSVQITWT